MTTPLERLLAVGDLTMTTGARRLITGGEWDHYRTLCRLNYRGRTMEVPYHQGTAHVDPPTRADVIETLLDDSAGLHQDGETLAWWAEAHGYEPDSPEARRTYKNVKAQDRNLRALLGTDYAAWMHAGQEN